MQNEPNNPAHQSESPELAEVATDASVQPLPERSAEMVQETLLGLWESAVSRLPFFIAGIGVLILTGIISRIVQSIARRLLVSRRFNRSFRDLALQIISVAVWVLGLTVAAVIIFPGMTPAKVLAGLGIGSVALGFAFKDIVENFLAGILILWKFPFEPGDFIRCNGIEGKVEEVTIRMTLMRQTDGELVVIPNAQLFKNSVFVLTADPVRRVTVICGVAYDEDVDNCRGIIKQAVEDCKTVSKEKEVEIFAQEFASSSINFEVTWWCKPTPLDVRASRDEVVAAVKRALDDAGVEIPFPYQTLTFKEPLPVQSTAESDSPGN